MRRLLLGVAVVFVGLVVFHRPILRAVLHSLVVHFAGKQNLRLEFQIEGSVLRDLELRHLHATPTGPSAIASLDADLVRADYSLTNLIFHGMSESLKNVELHSASVV